MSSLSVTRSIIVLAIFNLVSFGSGTTCVPRNFGQGSVVCVCNSTHCDSAARDVPERGKYRSYESSKDGARMDQRVGLFIGNSKDGNSRNNETSRNTIILNPNQKFQQIQGFGGAFTDSSGLNIRRLSRRLQNHLIESYFGVNGSRYNLGRVPVAGTDFSLRPYTYDDHPGDLTLKRFQLANEDYLYKIPIMKRARNLNSQLRFVSASWTAPPWMKTNDNFTGYGLLKPQYYQLYAEYLTRFLVEYKNLGLNIWAISTGNEPDNILASNNMINSMGWTPDSVSQWLAKNFGPTIERSVSNETLVLIIDDQRYNLPWYVVDVFKNPTAKNYTAGIALHWYFDAIIVVRVLNDTHSLYPDKFLLITEGCVGTPPWYVPGVSLGDWNRAEKYITDLMQNFNHWITGYVDWNLVLDRGGGPSWADNFVDAPIIINPDQDEFFKQPSYYAIAHFSKFISRNSTRIGTINNAGSIENVVFLTPANEIVVVLYNPENSRKTIAVKDPGQGTISTSIAPHSIQTIIYRN